MLALKVEADQLATTAWILLDDRIRRRIGLAVVDRKTCREMRASNGAVVLARGVLDRPGQFVVCLDRWFQSRRHAGDIATRSEERRGGQGWGSTGECRGLTDK